MKQLHFLFVQLPVCILLSACIASGSGDPEPFQTAEPASVPQLPAPPVTSLTLGTTYTGFFIGTDGILPDGTLSQVLQYNQRMYELSATNVITEVPLLNGTEAFDMAGNIVFPDNEGLIPNDLMVLSEKYILLAIRQRDLDGDADNDYHNLFVDLTTGTVTAAPLGLNIEGNSGSLHVTTPGRDYFPPDARWNDTEDLYVIDVDYETLGLMESGEFVEEENEPVDHSAGVPDLSCNNPPATDDTTDDATDNTATDAADAADDTATDTTTDATDTADTATDDTTTTTTDSNCPATDTTDDTATDTTTDNTDVTAAAQSLESMGLARNIGSRSTEEEPKIPTAVYRVRLGADGTYSLDKISAPGDRPGLGQFVVSRSGVMIYRNDDGGDNSYRVLISGCEDITGRLSTVLRLKNSTLMVADDTDGESTVFEITQRGINKLYFSCNGNVIRESYSGYTTGINSLRMPMNSQTTAPYEYEFPYLISGSCDTVRLFPRQDPESVVENPMPPIPGLPSQDPRTLRKAQYFNQRLYCLGYDEALVLTVAELNPATTAGFVDLNFDLSAWSPDFSTLHLLDASNIIFTGQPRGSFGFQTIQISDQGVETDLTATIGGLEVKQHIEITPPPPPPVVAP